MANEEKQGKLNLDEIKNKLPEMKNKLQGMKNKFRMDLFLYLIMGVLLGVIIKTEAAKRVVIGFDDYKLAGIRQDYNINRMEKDLLEKAKSQVDTNSQQEPEVQTGGISE